MSLGRMTTLIFALAAFLVLTTSAIEAAGGSRAQKIAEQAFRTLDEIFSSSPPERFPKIEPELAELWVHLSDEQRDLLVRYIERLPTTRSIEPRWEQRFYLDDVRWLVDQHVWREWLSGEFRPDRRSKRCLSRAARKILTREQRELLFKRVVDGMTQVAVAKAWNIRRQTVARWERGLKSEAVQQELRGAYEACVAHQRAEELLDGNVAGNGAGTKRKVAR